MLHTKTMDYNIACARQKINNETAWSDSSLSQNFGAHHRYQFAQFVRECFFDPANIVSQGKLQPFDFTEEIAQFEKAIEEKDSYYWIPMNMNRWVEMPIQLRAAF